MLHFAVLGGDLPTIEYIYGLLPREAALATNAFGCGAPHWAAAAGNVEVAEWLFARGFTFAGELHVFLIIFHSSMGVVICLVVFLLLSLTRWVEYEAL